MGEVIRTIKVAVSLLVLLITGKVIFDLLREAYHSKSLQHWGLLGLFLTIASTAIMMVTATYALELPAWLHTWHIINMLMFAIAIYHMLMELDDE